MPYLIDVRTVKGKGGPLKADVSIDKLVIVTVTRGKAVKKLKNFADFLYVWPVIRFLRDLKEITRTIVQLSGNSPHSFTACGPHDILYWVQILSIELPPRLPHMPSATVWKAGGVYDVAWRMQANHGGGYSYRLCPLGDRVANCLQSDF